MRGGLLIGMWKRLKLDITKWPGLPSTRSANSSGGGSPRHTSYLLPAPFLAFGLMIGKCDTDPNCGSSSGPRIPPCAPNCSKEDLNAIRVTHYGPQSTSCNSKTCPTPATVLGLVGSENKEKNPEPEEYTHHFLIKQGATVLTDSVTRLLTQSVSAFDDYHNQYRDIMDTLMGLLEESRIASPVNQELVNCKMIVLRSQMEDIRQNLNEIEMFLSSVEVLVNQTAITCYLARAEYPSIALSERLQSAMLEVGRIKGETKEKESDLVQLQALIIVESGKSLK